MIGFCSPRATKYGTTSICSLGGSSIDDWRRRDRYIMRWLLGSCLDLGVLLLHVHHGLVQNFHVLHPGSLVDLARIHHGLVGSFLRVHQHIRFHRKQWLWVGGAQRRFVLLQWSEGLRRQQLNILRWFDIQRKRSSRVKSVLCKHH